MVATSAKVPVQGGHTPTMAYAEQAARALVEDGVDCVLLFGSVARGDQGPGSDIDMLAVYDDGSIPNFHDTANYLSDIANPRDRRYPTAARAEEMARAAIRMVVLARTTIEQVLEAEDLTLSEDYPRQLAGVGVDISEAEKLVRSIDMASGMSASTGAQADSRCLQRDADNRRRARSDPLNGGRMGKLGDKAGAGT